MEGSIDLKQELEQLKSRVKSLEDNMKSNDGTDITFAKEIININNKIHNIELELVKLDSNTYRQPIMNQQFENNQWSYQNQNIKHKNKVNKPRKNKIKSKLSEINFGKYIIGILASLLILVAVVMFAQLIWDKIPAIVKWAGIELLGTSIFILGSHRIIKCNNHNGFWTSLASCGAGIAFIGAISGNMIWNLYGLTITAAIVAVWFIGITIVASRIESLVFYIVAYCGSIIATVLAIESFGSSIVETKNQILYIIILLIWVGVSENSTYNKVTNIKHLSKVNLIFNISLLLINHLLLCDYSDRAYGKTLLIVGIIQLAMSVLLLIKVQSEDYENTHPVVAWIERLVGNQTGTLFMLFSLCSLWGYGEWIFDNQYSLMICVFSLLIIIYLAIGFPKEAQNQILCNSIVISMILSCLSDSIFENEITILSMVLLISIIASKLIPDLNTNKIRITNLVCYIITLILYMDSSYHGDEINLKMLVVFNGMLMISMNIIDYISTFKLKQFNLLGCRRLLNIGLLFIVLWPIKYTLDISDNHLFIIFVTLLVLHRILVMNKVSDGKTSDIVEEVLYVITTVIIHFKLYLDMMLSGWLGNITLCDEVEITIMIMAMAITNLYTCIIYKGKFRTALAVITWNINIFAIADLWDKSNLILMISLVGIMISALFITLGFIFKNKGIRVMGLITLIVYVLKVVIFDISSTSGSGMNILMIALGGLICFGLSFAYNKLDKIYGNE